MKKILLTLAFVICGFYGYCADTKIVVNSELKDNFTLRLFKIGGISTTLLESEIKTGRNEFTVDIKTLQYYGLSQNKQYDYTLIAPSKDLIINVSKDGNVTYDGNFAAVNNYISNMQKQSVKRGLDRVQNFTKDICSSHINYYEKTLNEIKRSSLSAEDKGIVSGYAQSVLLKDVYSSIISSKVFGKVFKIEVEEGYADKMAKLRLLPTVIYYPQCFDYITELCYTRMSTGMIKIKDADNWIEYFAKSIKNESVRDAYIAYLISREWIMGYCGGLARAQNALKLIVSPEVKSEAESMIKWFKDVVGVGYDVSNIETLDKDGNRVLLGQFKGKYIFIDFWSTGCNPCIGEIPYMRAIEHSLHSSKLDFVSITLDNDENIWRKYLADNDMVGNQLFLVGGFKNPIRKAIGMSGIPHFILIGPDSKIVNPNTYRPSNPILREQLKSVVAK